MAEQSCSRVNSQKCCCTRALWVMIYLAELKLVVFVVPEDSKGQNSEFLIPCISIGSRKINYTGGVANGRVVCFLVSLICF